MFRRAAANFLKILAYCLRALSGFVHIVTSKVESAVILLNGRAIDPTQDLSDIDLSQLSGYEESRHASQEVKSNQRLKGNLPIQSLTGSPPRHWLEYVQSKLAERAVQQHERPEITGEQTEPSSQKEGYSNVLGIQHDTAKTRHERLGPDVSKDEMNRQQQPYPAGQSQEKSETETRVEHMHGRLTKQAVIKKHESTTKPGTRTEPYGPKESHGNVAGAQYHAAEIQPEHRGTGEGEIIFKQQSLQVSKTRDKSETDTGVERTPGQDGISIVDGQTDEERLFTDSARFRRYNTVSAGFLPINHRIRYNLADKENLRYPIEQTMGDSISASAESDEQRWPALPDIQRYPDEQTLSVLDWEAQLRTWHRRQRLDKEQKGILWSESPF